MAAGCDKILALSMYPLEKDENQKLQVIPPLLRSNITQLRTTKENFILAYLVHSGYMQDIIQWHNENPCTIIHCFTDSGFVKKEKGGKWIFDDTLIFHSLQDALFIQMLASCSGLVSTAGFESICEALYLSKPVMMVPVKGQYEQFCNAVDAQRCGAGIHAHDFNITKLVNYRPFHHYDPTKYQSWANQTENLILQSLYELYPDEHPHSPIDKNAPLLKIV